LSSSSCARGTVNGKYEKLAQCLLACGASTDLKPPGEKTTVAGLARQYDTPTSRLVLAHHAASKRRAAAAAATIATTKKRKRASSTPATSATDLATSVEGKDAAAEPELKAPKKKKEREKKEPEAEKLREKELEAEVRRLAKLDHYDDKTKLDVFTLRRMLRVRGVLARDMPTRKLALLELAVDWFGAGN
jgi:hypothetical protein